MRNELSKKIVLALSGAASVVTAVIGTESFFF